MLDGAATFLEKLPAFAFRSGLIVAIVGGALHAGLNIDLIDDGALNGYVAQSAPVLWVSGLAMAAAAIIIALPTWLAFCREFVGSWRKKRLKRARLLSNISFLDNQSLLILLLMLRLPMGRMEATPLPAFERLHTLGLIASENYSFFVSHGCPTGMMCVAQEVFRMRKGLDEELTKLVSSRYNIDVALEENLLNLITAEHEKFSGKVVYR